jgi:large subunit ribosomal protein L15
MVVHKRKKVVKYRGSHTHGGGSKKKRRGAGHRGGRGMAGSGKRGDQKKPMIWKNGKYFGSYGFKYHGLKDEMVPINVSQLCELVDILAKEKLVELNNNVYKVDLKKIGYNKLLGSGKVTKKLEIVTPYASSRAIEKVQAAGGKVEVTKPAEQEEVTEAKE